MVFGLIAHKFKYCTQYKLFARQSPRLTNSRRESVVVLRVVRHDCVSVGSSLHRLERWHARAKTVADVLLRRWQRRLRRQCGCGDLWCDRCWLVLRIRSVVEFAQVFLEIEVPAKPFATDVTRERLLVVVSVHVKRQVVHLMESFMAHCALKRFFHAVR